MKRILVIIAVLLAFASGVVNAQEIKMDFHSGSKAMFLRTLPHMLLEDKVFESQYVYGSVSSGGIKFIAAAVTNLETGATVPYVYLEANTKYGKPYAAIDYDEIDGVIEAIDSVLAVLDDKTNYGAKEYAYKYYGTRDGIYVYGRNMPYGGALCYSGIMFGYYRPEIVVQYKSDKLMEIRELLVYYKELFNSKIKAGAIEKGKDIDAPDKSNVDSTRAI